MRKEDQAKTRWQTWFFAAWMPGKTKYPGFRYYLLDIIWKISSKVQKTIFFDIKMAGKNPKKKNKFVLWT
jgi:hypothetical protein